MPHRLNTNKQFTIVNNATEKFSTFDLREQGGTYQFEKKAEGIQIVVDAKRLSLLRQTLR